MGAVPVGENKEYDDVERFFKNPTYEGTSGRINTQTASESTRAAASAVMYDTVGQPSSRQTVTMTTQAAAGNGHMYEALDKQDANGTTPYQL